VEQVARRAERYLRDPLRVVTARGTLTVPAALLAPALTLSGGSAPRLSVPRAGLAPVLRRIAARLDRPARPPRFGRAGASVVVTAKGAVTWRPRRVEVGVEAGRAGRIVDQRRAGLRIGDAVRAGRHRVRVPVRRDPLSITAAQARRVDSVIGTFTTPYEPGQPRVRNIQRIARAVDGTVVAPGAQFSLNGAAGQRTREKGYVEAPFIADGKIEPSVGGGVSQFSTTLYNAAYFAGLRLDSSQPHSLYIDRYPPGREATLNFGSIDLRWTNDTAAPVVIQTSYTDTSVTVRLLGDNGGRRVRAVPGAREPVDGGDFQIAVTRVVRYADGRETETPRTTRYETPRE
jgi:vancomycin resistance protein YoaR